MANVLQQVLVLNVFVKRVPPVFYVNDVSSSGEIDHRNRNLFFSFKLNDQSMRTLVHSIVKLAVPVFMLVQHRHVTVPKVELVVSVKLVSLKFFSHHPVSYIFSFI